MVFLGTIEDSWVLGTSKVLTEGVLNLVLYHKVQECYGVYEVLSLACFLYVESFPHL